MEKIETIEFKELSVGGKCELFHHGIVLDCLENFSYKMYAGKIYGIIGEFGCGGAALSCGITGHTKYFSGEILINNKKIEINDIQNYCWYVGKDMKSNKIFKRKNSIKNQIEQGINNGNTDINLNEIKRMFDLSDERINRNIEYVSGERWKMSVAIGFANNRKIYCYPWLNTNDIKLLGSQISKTISILLQNNFIIILPTTTEENIKMIYPQYEIIDL